MDVVVVIYKLRMNRRNFLIWLPLAVMSFIALAINLLNKAFRYIGGPKLTLEQEAKLIEKRIRSLEQSVTLERLKSERLVKDKIFICDFKDLKKTEGVSFVDFNLKPALAFLGKNDKPILVSSVCTHLGCTIQNQLNRGKLFCPCHITYFDLESSKVLEGPAKSPLPKIPFVIESEKVFIVKNA